MRLILALFLLIGITVNVISQDIKLTIDEIEFTSELEKKYFLEVSQGDFTHIVESFILSGPDKDSIEAVTNGAKIYNDIYEFSLQKAAVAKPKKQIKTCYSFVHNKYFDKYLELTYFDEIFKNRYFNCVTGTAMYAIYFERLGIPYEMRESINHIYLVAYPKLEEIKVESTNPNKGVVAYPDIFKQTFVNYLNKGKLISENENTTNTEEELFNKYFYRSDKAVGMKELLSIQYSNSAMNLIRNGSDLREAIPYIEKAYYLYPNERNSFVYLSFLSQIMLSYKTQDPGEIPYFIKYGKYINLDISSEQYVNNYLVIGNALLIENGKLKDYMKLNEAISQLIIDKETRTMLQVKHELLLIAYYSTKGNVNKSYAHSLKAYYLAPDNLNVQNVLCEAMVPLLNTIHIHDALDSLLAIRNNNNTIESNNIFMSLKAELLLLNASLSFENGNLRTGNAYITSFEEIYDNNRANLADTEIIGDAYVSKALLHFRRGEKKYARQAINKGLEYSPYHRRLNQSKRML